jgi:xylose isomerase
MSRSYFDTIAPIAYRGPGSTDPLSFRWYDKDRRVLGKRMEDHLRFAVCYWHNFVWTGLDPFGGATFQRPWFEGGTPMQQAARKAEAAFAFFEKLGVPYYCFHDRDVAPEGATARESHENFRRLVGLLGEHQQRSGVKLLWGTANLFSHRRFMSGAASNPDPALFAMAALQVRDALQATLELGGENYVLWGGREGYETLLNTRVGRSSTSSAASSTWSSSTSTASASRAPS